MSKKFVVAAGIAVLAMTIGGCATSSDGPQLADLPEELTFHGHLTGTLDTGLSVYGRTPDHPVEQTRLSDGTTLDAAPSKTRCFTNDDAGGMLAQDLQTRRSEGATIVGIVGGHRVGLLIRTDGLFDSVQLFIDGDPTLRKSAECTRNSPCTVPSSTITIDADRTGGTLDAWLGPWNPDSTQSSQTTHIVGRWRCG
ncbi:hypothetical protein [Nocardia sp. NPDC127526]|uniref:hypothetical protein n=1 Tax=Nocardia sp. NPDC127526 TaxID=3345393 RepID=UPI003634B912